MNPFSVTNAIMKTATSIAISPPDRPAQRSCTLRRNRRETRYRHPRPQRTTKSTKAARMLSSVCISNRQESIHVPLLRPRSCSPRVSSSRFVRDSPRVTRTRSRVTRTATYDCDKTLPALQEPRDSWTGGHFTDPYEQKTQQSPGFGRSTVWQLAHS